MPGRYGWTPADPGLALAGKHQGFLEILAVAAAHVWLHREQAWRIVTSLRCPSLRTARILARELRISPEAVATACEQAHERELRRLDVERARREALLG
jgi:hypothetical protein